MEFKNVQIPQLKFPKPTEQNLLCHFHHTALLLTIQDTT